eukprot:7378859-Prymnesium_polylepis.1
MTTTVARVRHRLPPRRADPRLRLGDVRLCTPRAATHARVRHWRVIEPRHRHVEVQLVIAQAVAGRAVALFHYHRRQARLDGRGIAYEQTPPAAAAVVVVVAPAARRILAE